jgi:hypothetical protein
VLQRPGIRTDLPPYLLTVTQQDLAKQVARWNATARWSSWLVGYPAVFQALRDEAHDHGGCIRREFAHSYATRDPMELFYVVMAWGFGTTNVRWPGHQAILGTPPRESIKGIVDEVQTQCHLARVDHGSHGVPVSGALPAHLVPGGHDRRLWHRLGWWLAAL